MSKLRICFEVNGLATDENGTPSPAGLQLDFGDILLESVNYEKLTADIDIQKMLEISFLGKHIDPKDVRVITPEEYDLKYGNNT